MILADKFTCDMPDFGNTILNCDLPGAGGIEWFAAVVSALSVLIAGGAAWFSYSLAKREHDRAERAEKRSLRERLSNQSVQAFATFALDPLGGEMDHYITLASETLPYRENLDQDDAIDKRIHDTLLECLRCAGMITTYAVYFDVLVKEEIPLDRQIRLKGAADSLKLDVQQALHGIAYTQDDGRAMVLASKFDAEVAKLIKTVEENTKVEGND